MTTCVVCKVYGIVELIAEDGAGGSWRRSLSRSGGKRRARQNAIVDRWMIGEGGERRHRKIDKVGGTQGTIGEQ